MKAYISEGQFFAPGTQPKGAEKVEVPTDTKGLVDYLNELMTETSAPAGELELAAPESPERQQQFEGTQVNICERFIMDKATPAQVEQLFAALGVRFHEMRKAARS